MTVKLTVIGLGQIGTSIGLALADETQQITRVGHDREIGWINKAKQLNAFDETHLRLIPAVQDADIIVLCEPADQVEETLQIIAAELKPESIVLDTSSLRQHHIHRAKELLPENVYFLTFTPSLSVETAYSPDLGTDAANANLFKRGTFFITSSPQTSNDAFQLASDLSVLLGSYPLLADPVETDGLSAAVHLLPQISAAALVRATMKQPGWIEARRLASRSYAEATLPLKFLDETEKYGQTMLYNRENIVRVIDNFMFELQTLRKALVENDSEHLQEMLKEVSQLRQDWEEKHIKADWNTEEKPEYRTSSDYFGQMFGLGKLKKDKNNK